jgi:hypothetical protein
LPFEGPGSDARKERLPEFETSPALELSKTSGADVFVAQGASPSMRERRFNGYYDALFMDKLQGFDKKARREQASPGLPASKKAPPFGSPLITHSAWNDAPF